RSSPEGQHHMEETHDEDDDIQWLGWLRRNSAPLFLPLLVLSFVIAATAVIRFPFGDEIRFGLAWLALFGIAFLAFKRRALWFLLGAPFALGPGILTIVYVQVCWAYRSCL